MRAIAASLSDTGHGRPRRVLLASPASRRRGNDDDQAHLHHARRAHRGLGDRRRSASRRQSRGRQGQGQGSLRRVPRRRRQQPRRPTIRSSPASTATISRRRCATTSRARARTPIMAASRARCRSRTSRTSPRITLAAGDGVVALLTRTDDARSADEAPWRASAARTAVFHALPRRSLSVPREAVEVERRVRRRAAALRVPDHLAQAFEHRVQRGVLVAVRARRRSNCGANAGRLVDRELLGDGEVQRQVQERIDVAALGRVVAVEVALGVLERARDTRDAARRGPRRSAPGPTAARCGAVLAHASIRKRRASSREGLNIVGRLRPSCRGIRRGRGSMHSPHLGARATQT